MITIDETVAIGRSREVVFDYVSDVSNYPRWQPGIERAEQVTPGAAGVGTRVKLVLRGPTGPTEVIGEIVEFDRPRILAIRSLSGPADMKARCELEATDGDAGTQLRLTASIELKGFLRFAEGQARKIVGREMPTALADLAGQIEAGA